MPLYVYKAVTTEGKIVEGQLEGSDQRDVVQRLHALGHTPIRAQEATQAMPRRVVDFLPWVTRKDRPSRHDMLAITRQLATLLSAGLELDRCLGVMIDVAENETTRKLLLMLRERIRGGGSLSDAMQAQGDVFSSLYINLVRAGEAAGALELILQRLADYLEHAEAVRESVKSALIYPAILVTVATLSVVVLLTFVLPQFTALFEDMGATLPLATQLVIGLGDITVKYGWLGLAGVVAAGLAIRRAFADPEKRYRWDAWLLKAPLISALIRKIQVARFSKTLGTLLGNGIHLVAALGIVKDTLTNRALAKGMDRVIESLKHGGGLAAPLAASGVFPADAVHMLRVGEETGELDKMLLKIADVYDKEVERAIQRLLAFLEPVLILGMALVVLAIIVPLLLAILSINDIPI
ncbi:MAG: type II secretion system F family protein [Gammaproteobacteria bacterium]